MVVVADSKYLSRTIQREGPEANLIERTLNSISRLAGPSGVVLREPRLPTGFPDLVLAKPHRDWATWKSSPVCKLSSMELSLVHHVAGKTSSSLNEVADTLGWSPQQISNKVGRLQDQGFLFADSGGGVRVGEKLKAFMPQRIIAVEAKVHDWRNAINQAVANTWFASESYILLPAEIGRSTVGDEASRLGIGVLVFDGKQTYVTSRAVEHSLPRSYGSWLVANLVGMSLAG